MCSQSSEAPVENRDNESNNNDFDGAENAACTTACTDSLYQLIDDPVLATIVPAWPHIPEHIRQTIITIVEAATQGDSAKEGQKAMTEEPDFLVTIGTKKGLASAKNIPTLGLDQNQGERSMMI